LLKDWQEKTGNTVIDCSTPVDESWKIGILRDFAAGNEADVFFFFARTGDSVHLLPRVVPIAEINEAYPELELPEIPSLTEADGKIYAIPVRPFWEGLFCNVDLFEQYGLELPTTWEKMEIAVETFHREGIVPIAVSLSDTPHYIAEFCILAAGSPAEHLARPRGADAVPRSWTLGMELLHTLYTMNAFPANVNATTHAAVSELFSSGRAAMQIDGSWFANGLPADSMDSTVVIPFPVWSPDADPTAFIGGVSMGFYLSRSAWDDPEKRAAAVDLLAFLSTGDNAAALGGFAFTGRLLESSYEMLSRAQWMNAPIQDVMNPEARACWFGAIPGIAEGMVDPAQMWTEVMGMSPFAAE